MSTNDPIQVRPATNEDCKSVQNLIFDVLHEYGLKPAPDGIDRDISDIEANFIGRGGVFEVLEDPNGLILGTVGLYPLDDSRIELRKMYFAKEIRGKGLGKKTLNRMIETAKDLGYKQVVLETASVLVEAIGLYKSFGFHESSAQHTPRCDQAFYLNL